MLKQETIDLIEKINKIKLELSSYIYEREEALNLITIALIAKRNLFFLGKPGQAKTFVVHEFAKRVSGANYYEALMHKQMDTEETFGRLDIPSLVQGKASLITKDKLPEAHINFLDEIFKASDIMLNTLLKVLNFEEINLEGKNMKLPTLATFCASNEIPNFKKEEDKILAPMYDRLHLKYVTNYISDDINMMKAIRAKRRLKGNNQVPTTITLNEIEKLNEAAQTVSIPEDIDRLMLDICKQVSSKLNKSISDRKKIEYSILVQTCALLNKRDIVQPEDLNILIWYLWDTPDEIDEIKKIVTNYTDNPLKNKISPIMLMAAEQIGDAFKCKDQDIKNKNKAFGKAEKELFKLHSSLMIFEKDIRTDDDKTFYKNALSELEDMYKNLNSTFGYSYVPIQQMKERMNV